MFQYTIEFYSSEESVNFGFNLGLFIPQAYSIYFDSAILKFPKEYECIDRQRLHRLKGNEYDWYILNPDTNIDDLKIEIQQVLTDSVIPYFNKNKDIEEILERLFSELKPKEDPQHISQLAIGLFLFIDKEKGQNLLKKHYNNSGNETYLGHLKMVAKRAGIDLK